MTMKELDRQRKEEVRERIRAERETRREAKAEVMRSEMEIKAQWHVSNAKRQLEYCSRMTARLEQRVAELQAKVDYFQSIGLPYHGYEEKLFKAMDDLFKHQERVGKAELDLDVWQHRLDNLDVLF